MSTNMEDYLVRTESKNWKPLIEAGVNTTGISWMPLRYDETGKRPLSFLSKFEPGAEYPYHNHPGGEEIFVVEGSCEIEGMHLIKGDYLYTPIDFKHSVKTKNGCTLFFNV